MGWIIKLIAILAVLLCTGTAAAEEQAGSITVYLEYVEGNLTVYRTDVWAEENPDALAASIKKYDVQGITKPIVAGTPTVFADLPQGRYLVTHEDDAFRPFLVTIPITINGSTSFAVEARPKTQDSQSPQTGDPTDLGLLCGMLLISAIGMACMVRMHLAVKKSALGGNMFLRRVQIKQKRLR